MPVRVLRPMRDLRRGGLICLSLAGSLAAGQTAKKPAPPPSKPAAKKAPSAAAPVQNTNGGTANHPAWPFSRTQPSNSGQPLVGTGRLPVNSNPGYRPQPAFPANRTPGGASPTGAQPFAANHRPSVPAGVRPQPVAGGGSLYTDRSGRQTITDRNNNVREVRTADQQMRFDGSGRPRFYQSSHNGNTTSVIPGVGNQRTVQSIRSDGTRVVSYGPHNGFVERPLSNHPGFVTRSVVQGGVTHVSVYQATTYLNHPVYRFVPTVAYRPAFYGWVLSPWSTPVVYAWGPPVWGGFYGAYFTPYPSYPSANLWLTDYILNTDLQQAYAEQQPYADQGSYPGQPGQEYPATSYANPSSPGGTPPASYPNPGDGPPPNGAANYVLPQPGPLGGGGDQLSPEVKALIAQQVKTDLVELQSASAPIAANPSGDAVLTPAAYVPTALKPDHTVFEISTDMQLQVGPDQSCNLTPGDALFRRPSSTVDADGNVAVIVVGSTHGGCPVNTLAKISLQALQDIDNQLEDQLQTALGVMQQKSRNGTLPSSPAPGAVQLAATTGAAVPNADALLQQTQGSGAQTEAEVTNTF